MEKGEVNALPIVRPNTETEEPGYARAWNMQALQYTLTYGATTALFHFLSTGSSSVKAVPKLAPTPKSEGPRRSLNLADYKKRRGLI